MIYGNGIDIIDINRIRKVNDKYGKPFIKLHGKASIIFKNMNKTSNTQIEVSLSDEKKYAIANVTIYD